MLNGANAVGTRVAKLPLPGDAGLGRQLFLSVAVDGDTLVVGNANNLSAHVLTRSVPSALHSSWTHRSVLVDPDAGAKSALNVNSGFGYRECCHLLRHHRRRRPWTGICVCVHPPTPSQPELSVVRSINTGRPECRGGG